MLEDGLKLEYDSLILATGVVPEVRNVQGIEGKDNITFLNNIEDHKKVKKYLENAKTVVNLQVESDCFIDNNVNLRQYWETI